MKGTVYDKRHQFDKTGNPLRTRRQATGWWFTPTGPSWWIRQRKDDYNDGKGNYYVPGQPFPVVPPRELWGTQGFRREYHGPIRRSGVSDNVPDDVRLAYAGLVDTKGRQIHGGYDTSDRSERSTEYDRRKGRHIGNDDREPSKKSKFSVLWWGKRANAD